MQPMTHYRALRDLARICRCIDLHQWLRRHVVVRHARGEPRPAAGTTKSGDCLQPLCASSGPSLLRSGQSKSRIGLPLFARWVAQYSTTCLRLGQSRIVFGSVLLGLSGLFSSGSVLAQTRLDVDAEIGPFAVEVAREHGIDEGRVRRILADAKILPNVLSAMSRPAEGKEWREYRPIFLTEKRIAQGVAFWEKNRDLLEAAREKFGVSEQMIVAIIGVETFYGQRAGSIRVLDALATLGFRFPRRAAFFRRELGHYMVLTQSENLDVMQVKGSYAGAMGIPQFIPSSYREYAVDFDGDGRRDLITNVADAIGSVAAYFSRHGWVSGEPVTVAATAPDGVPEHLLDKGLKPYASVAELAAAGVRVDDVALDGQRRAALVVLDGVAGKEYWLGFNNFYVITRYNRSPLYAMAVYQLSQAIAERRRARGA